MSNLCNQHDIVWDTSSIDIRVGKQKTFDDEFDEHVEFTGKCINCQRVFLKTYVDPRYSELRHPDNILENAYRESIKTQKWMNLESMGGLKN